MAHKYETAISLVWDRAAGHAVPVTADDAKAKRSPRGLDVWGATDSDPTVKGIHSRFAPSRDIRWSGREGRVFDQCERLVSLGVPLKSHRSPGGLFADAAGMDDLGILHELATGQGKWRNFRLGGFRCLADAAPDLFVAQELVKATGEIIREEFVELTARRELEFVDYNTYLQVYAWDRMDRRGPIVAKYANLQDTSGFSYRKTQAVRQQVFGSLMPIEDGCSWTDMELMVYAEAQANGAPVMNIVSEEMALVRRRMLTLENFQAYFGMPGVGVPGAKIWGLLTHPDIPHVAAGTFGSSPAGDVEVILGPIKENFIATQNIESYDKIMVGLNLWAYLTTTDYKDASSDSNETVADVLMRKASAFGVKSLVMVPEMAFRSEQETRLIDEGGISASLAQTWAGGFEGADAIALVKSDPKKGVVARGKDIAMLPQEVRHGTHEAGALMSIGGFDVRQPLAFKILKDVVVPS